MKITKKKFNLKDDLNKEWILSNGIGGYASTTVAGANTRRYHGLLVASLNNPGDRNLILSKLDESIVIGDESYNLYTNICKNYISQGYKYLDSFEKEYFPVYTFKVKDIKLEKKISLIYGKNAVVVNYKIKNGKKDSKLVLTPVVNFRDFHSLSYNQEFEVKQLVTDLKKVKLQINKNPHNVYMSTDCGIYVKHENDTFKSMLYLKEEERGFNPTIENLSVPGSFEIEIASKEEKEVNFVLSLDKEISKIDFNQVFEDEIQRQKEIIDNSSLLIKKSKLTKNDKEYNEVIKDLILSSDTFIDNKKLKNCTILAGYPWFIERTRNALISFEGLFLTTKRYDLAKEYLLTVIKNLNNGLLPGTYSDYDNSTIYNSVDVSLLLFEEVYKYGQITRDYDFIKSKLYKKLKEIIKAFQTGIKVDDNNIYIDKEDNLLVSGTESVQNTWMNIKVKDEYVTPRFGKVVEVNALWYNALKIMDYFANKFEDKKGLEIYKKEASIHQKSFEEKFYNTKKKCLEDVLGSQEIRPNQLISIALSYPVIKPSSEIGKNVYKICKSKLFTKYGLRTLAKGEEGYKSVYEGDTYERDMAYHQGIVWVWLIGVYHDSLKNIIDDEKDRLEKEKYLIEYEKLIKNIYQTFKSEIYENGIGTISEIYNSQMPYKACGSYSDACSVSEVLRIITKLKK